MLKNQVKFSGTRAIRGLKGIETIAAAARVLQAATAQLALA